MDPKITRLYLMICAFEQKLIQVLMIKLIKYSIVILLMNLASHYQLLIKYEIIKLEVV